jgi:hypothetical protein
MSKRVDETDEEYRTRHREEERLRREDPEYAAKTTAYKQRADVKAKHAALERERRKTKQVKAYDREYRKVYRDKNREKTREYHREHQRKRRAALKAAGLPDPYKPTPEKARQYYLAWEARNPQHTMVERAKSSAKQRGLEFAITTGDLVWPTHCSILGIELCYDRDKKTPQRDNYPTLDRWDNSKGYVPGNVFVISWRANRMKWHSTVKELEAILRYMKEKPSLEKPHAD